MKKTVKIVLVVAAVIVLLLLIVELIGSPIAKRVVINHSEDWIGRKVEMSSLWVDPFLGNVTIKDFSCTDADSDEEFVSFSRLRVQISLLRLIGKHVYLRHIHLDDINGNIWSNDTCFNFSDLPQRFASSDTTMVEEEADTIPSKWLITLNDIRLRRGHVSYTDRHRDRSWTLENINLIIPGVSFGRGQTNAGLSLDLPNDGGNVLMRGAYNMQSDHYSLILDLKDIDVSEAQPLLSDFLNIGDLKARLSGHLLAYGTLNDIMAVRVEGNVGLDDIDIKDADNDRILSAKSVNIGISQIVPQTLTMRFDTISIDSVHLNFERANKYNTISKLLKESETDDIDTAEVTVDEAPKDKTSQLPLKLSVNHFLLSRSAVHYVDRTLFSRFKYDITSLSARAENLTLDGNNHIVIHGNLPNGGNFMVNWRGAMDVERDNARIIAMLKNVQLSDLSPWTEYMFANPIKSGTLSVNSDNTIRRGIIDAVEQIDIYDLKLGRKNNRLDAEMKSIPLKTAVDLIKDVNGKISMQVPITGDMKSPKFSLGKVIGRAIGNVLLNATAAPFMAMAQAQNVKIDDLTQLEINMLVPDFTLEQYAKLDLVAQMMQEKEELNLQMIQQFNLADAISERAVFNLKKEFYQYKLGEALIGNLTLLDIQRIMQIKDNQSDFVSYITPIIGEKGKLVDRAIDYYTADSLQVEVLKHAERHNQFLMRYLTENKQLSKKRVDIRLAELDELTAYSGKSRYTIEAKISE